MSVTDRLNDRRQALDVAIASLAAESGAIEAAARALATTLAAGGRVLAAGNGGSASEAQHFTGELIGRLSPARERGALAGIALTADTSTLTALANDYGYDQVFARQVAAFGRAGDTLVVLSTSGSSANCVAAVDEAKRMGITTIALVGGTRRALHDSCDVVIAVPATDIPTIQECHLLLVHLLVELMEDHLLNADAP